MNLILRYLLCTIAQDYFNQTLWGNLFYYYLTGWKLALCCRNQSMFDGKNYSPLLISFILLIVPLPFPYLKPSFSNFSAHERQNTKWRSWRVRQRAGQLLNISSGQLISYRELSYRGICNVCKKQKGPI